MASDVCSQCHSVQASLDKMMQMLRQAAADREDDRIIIHGISVQSQIHSERLRKLDGQMSELTSSGSVGVASLGQPADNCGMGDRGDVTVAEIRDIVDDVVEKNMSKMESSIGSKIESVLAEIKDENKVTMEDMKRNHQVTRDQIIKGTDHLKQSFNDNMNDLRADVNMGNIQIDSKLDTINKKFEEDIHPFMCQMSETSRKTENILKEQSDNLVNMENALIHFADRAARMATITTLRVTELQSEVASLKAAVKSSEQAIADQMKTQERSLADVQSIAQSQSQSLANMDIRFMIHANSLADVKSQLGRSGKLYGLMQEQSWSIIDQIVSEARLNREIFRSTRVQRRTYTCDMFIYGFSELVGSKSRHYSRLWYVDQLETHVKGRVRFLSDKFDFCLALGRCPRVIGMEEKPQREVKITSRLVKQDGKGDDWQLGIKTFDVNEAEIGNFCDGWKATHRMPIATLSCTEITHRGLVTNNQVLLRFVITPQGV